MVMDLVNFINKRHCIVNLLKIMVDITLKIKYYIFRKDFKMIDTIRCVMHDEIWRGSL